MTSVWGSIRGRDRSRRESARGQGVRIPIATKFILSFLAVIAVMSIVFIALGVRLIGDRVVAEAQETVRNDLNAAREIKLGRLGHINDVVRLTAGRFFLRDALASGEPGVARAELVEVMTRENLDVLSLTDPSGTVVLRASNPRRTGGSQRGDEIVGAVMEGGEPVAATSIVSAEELQAESSVLAARAHFEFIDTPMARPREETEETAGMMLKAAAPVLDDEGALLGILYGGELLNRDYTLVDKIKQTVFENVKYGGKDIGTATVFQDDVRISTNVRDDDGSRAIGTRVSEEVYDRVVRAGQPWIGRAYVVNDWYISAYEPIESLGGDVIGMLYVGILEQKYTDIRFRTEMAFLLSTLAGVLVAVALAYLLSRRITGSINQLVTASREVAAGNLDAHVEVTSNDEVQELAETFNTMASALKRRDARLQELAKSRVQKSERLAMVGQLAAGVAHELNNPMQGIVTYSLMLLEDLAPDDPLRDSVEPIVRQANRCTKIVRRLLDFSRPQTPDRKPYDVRLVLEETVSLVENQSLFHNIAIDKRFRDDVPLVVIDPSQIQQVMLNLIMNAAEAMEGEGLLTLSTRHDPNTNTVAVTVADTGPGISEEDMERVFVPFFTTKESGHGVGLGLAISYSIVKEHKGSIIVASDVGKGTTFLVRLPAHDEAAGDGDD